MYVMENFGEFESLNFTWAPMEENCMPDEMEIEGCTLFSTNTPRWNAGRSPVFGSESSESFQSEKPKPPFTKGVTCCAWPGLLINNPESTTSALQKTDFAEIRKCDFMIFVFVLK